MSQKERYPFELVSNHQPAGDQIKAIDQMVTNIKNNVKRQVLLGATGTGKTFSVANVIAKTQLKTIVLVHNKTLAGQLYAELKELFPNNRVEYFISFFDYYQPEAYKPTTDTYIEKDSVTNSEIEMMRLSTINSLATRSDVIVVASVACIYASVSPFEFIDNNLYLCVNQTINFSELKARLVALGYERKDNDLVPGTFRIRGEYFEIMYGFSQEYKVRIVFFGDLIESISNVDPVTNEVISHESRIILRSANEYVFDKSKLEIAINNIEIELKERVHFFEKENKLIEAQRIYQRTKQDIESIVEFGFCSGIENYYRHLEHRQPHQTPWTIFDFMSYGDEPWLMIVDESHISLPQVKGMHNTDRSRKQTLVEYGFRLPSALDNRPLNYDEFNHLLDNVIYVSATPNQEEIELSNNVVVDQIVRPTGLLDPEIEIRKTEYQFDDLVNSLIELKNKNERAFVVVMTIRMAEELSKHLNDTPIKSAYLHNELKTLERASIINKLRLGVYDCVVGINLLREGLDVPEVSTVFIFDADKTGFFRSDKALIQIIGRAARNINGKVIMYADQISQAMEIAINETKRRRDIQIAYNKKHNITPKTIIKPINEHLINSEAKQQANIFTNKSTKSEIDQKIKSLKKAMLDAAKERNYELAMVLRDQVYELEALKAQKDK
ncbi:excinuclease ABC subunit B [Ureaplasma diversum]|uniref:UvrABC system protein B n=1 Tax=Ureaplasma diversum TaxID=42094 RepID=A0A0C5RKZ3_9BACT|nr:excinuclease ABC subunit UvrB [Ureaplasma diversum]AJQ45082.1 excinuclease ABC subunit B [Ureaplasma diversum]